MAPRAGQPSRAAATLWLLLALAADHSALATDGVDAAALAADDECMADAGADGEGRCTLSVLQLRGAAVQKQEPDMPEDELEIERLNINLTSSSATGSMLGASVEPHDPMGIDEGAHEMEFLGLEGRCTAAYTPGAPQRYQDCRFAPNCCNPGFRCYEKGPSWAACLPGCAPGVHFNEPRSFWYPWSCRVIGGGGMPPAPAPHMAPSRPPPPVPAPAPPPGPAPAPATGAGLDTPSGGPLYTFYVYRAMSGGSYPPENVNVGNLAGVLWYLNNEVVITTPRKFGISRIVRYRLQTRATKPLLEKGMNFGVRFAFDSGQCTGPFDCAAAFKKYGYFVGCNNLGEFPFPTYQVHYPNAAWFSMPGRCPLRTYNAEDNSCRANEAGGACAGTPTGTGTCTYSYSLAGELSLEELEGGQGDAFWTGLNDDGKCQGRLQRALALFSAKYGGGDLPSPGCDFNRGNFYG